MSYEKRDLVDGETVIDKELLDHIQDGIVEAEKGVNTSEVRLAKQYDLAVGDTFQLFYRGVVKCFDVNNEGVHVSCAKGNAYMRYYQFVPTASDVGTYELTLKTRKLDGTVISEGKTNLVVHPTPTFSTAKTINMLGFGDSLTADGIWYGEGIRRLVGTDTSASGPASLKIANLNINTYGKKSNTVNTHSIKHEGYGGWTWGSFLATANSSSTVNGIFVTTASAHNYELNTVQKSVWTDNNGKLWELEDLPDEYTIKFNRGEGNSSAQNKTQTPTSLTCSDLNLTITTKSVSWESGNPFYDETTGRVNFVAHANECGVTDEPDIVACLLTWNGGGGSVDGTFEYQSKIEKQMNDATTLLRKIHSDFPNTKIVVMGIQLCSVTGGNAYNYNTANGYGDTWGTVMYAFDYNKALEDLVTNDEFGQYCYYVDTKGQFDTENMMPYYNTVVNTRSTEKEKRGSNGVHPSTAGYYQIGDAFFRKLIAILND